YHSRPGYKPPVAAVGWTFCLVSNGFNRPRSILFDQERGLLLVEARFGIKHSKLRYAPHDYKLIHGTILSPDGKPLYASTADRVYARRYDITAGHHRGLRHNHVVNMSNTDHTTRQSSPDVLLSSRVSAANINGDATRQSTSHSQLRAFDIGSLSENSQPFDYATEDTMLRLGLRNYVGVAGEPVTGGIWTVENSAD
ncbi:glucose sorbosone dehydrogenase, partial [Colletotrichum incanum]